MIPDLAGTARADLFPGCRQRRQRIARTPLEVQPGIGRQLAYTIDELVRTGEFRTMG